MNIKTLLSNNKLITFTLSLVFFLSACRKDDICTGDNTPKLQIAFHDITNQDTLKQVENFYLIALPENDTVINNESVEKISIALNVNQDQSRYIFTDDTNNDTITFNYQREEIFVSKACGYKMIFKNLTHNLHQDNDNWIQQIEVLQSNIVTDTTTHVKIYH